MAKSPSVENINLIQHKNDEKIQNTIPVNSHQKSIYSTKFNKKNHKYVDLKVSQQQQNLKNTNTSTCFVDKFNMNSLENNLPKLPLRTIWINDNVSQDLRCATTLKNNTLRKPISSDHNCLPPTILSVPKSKSQNKTQVLSNLSNALNNSGSFNSLYLLPSSSNHKTYSVPKNTNTSFFSSNNEKLPSASDCLNIEDIWKDN